MARRIGLVGGECTGKSALAAALAADLPACVADEALRDFVAQHGRAPRREEQSAVLLEQQQREDVAAAFCSHDWLVADPAPLMTAVYSLLYFEDGTLVAPAVTLAAGYDLVVWCDTDLPWTPDDGLRDGPEYREAAHALIAQVIEPALVAAGIRVVRVGGGIPDRVRAVRRAWQPGGSPGPT